MNQYLLAPALGWFLAQFIKFLIAAYKEKKLQFEWLWRFGGFPSSHSATVSGLVSSIYMIDGYDSATFAISLVMALIVFSDAIGVRSAAGLNSQAILKIVAKNKKLLPAHFRVVMGHRPTEVAVGVVIGIVSAILVV